VCMIGSHRETGLGSVPELCGLAFPVLPRGPYGHPAGTACEGSDVDAVLGTDAGAASVQIATAVTLH
jgi:hypothetical protein